MKNILFYITFFIVLKMSFGQVSESFETLENWNGETSKFELLEGRLHLNDLEKTGSAYLVTESDIGLDATWEFWLRLDFSPSGSNKIEIALMSDKAEITGDYLGYYLAFGETGSDDAIELFRKDGQGSELLARGIDARVGMQLDSIKIKIVRDVTNNWTVFSDIGRGYEEELIIMDSTYLESAYFGFHAVYTSTRSNLFFFDDVSIKGEVFVDDVAPKFISAVRNDDASITLTFDETIDTTILGLTNFSLNGVPPRKLFFEQKSIKIQFDELMPDVSLVLEVQGVKDDAGNEATVPDQIFQFHINKKADLVITELLFNPRTGGTDYIEIYNRTDFEIGSDGIQFISKDSDTGDTLQVKPWLTDFTFLPRTYYVFTEDKQSLLDNYSIGDTGLVIEMDIPSMNDDEGTIWLTSTQTLLDEVYYSEEYHAQYLTDVEGVSLERIDFNVSGLDANNWYSAAESVGYGTPITANSAVRQVGANSNFSLDTDRISPDEDGYQDFALLNYHDIAFGTLLTVTLFDRNGVKVNDLYQNYSISDTGYVKIEGVKQSNRVLSPGIYILLIEIVNENGTTESLKKTLTVNTRF